MVYTGEEQEANDRRRARAQDDSSDREGGSNGHYRRRGRTPSRERSPASYSGRSLRAPRAGEVRDRNFRDQDGDRDDDRRIGHQDRDRGRDHRGEPDRGHQDRGQIDRGCADGGNRERYGGHYDNRDPRDRSDHPKPYGKKRKFIRFATWEELVDLEELVLTRLDEIWETNKDIFEHLNDIPESRRQGIINVRRNKALAVGQSQIDIVRENRGSGSPGSQSDSSESSSRDRSSSPVPFSEDAAHRNEILTHGSRDHPVLSAVGVSEVVDRTEDGPITRDRSSAPIPQHAAPWSPVVVDFVDDPVTTDRSSSPIPVPSVVDRSTSPIAELPVGSSPSPLVDEGLLFHSEALPIAIPLVEDRSTSPIAELHVGWPRILTPSESTGTPRRKRPCESDIEDRCAKRNRKSIVFAFEFETFKLVGGPRCPFFVSHDAKNWEAFGTVSKLPQVHEDWVAIFSKLKDSTSLTPDAIIHEDLSLDVIKAAEEVYKTTMQSVLSQSFVKRIVSNSLGEGSQNVKTLVAGVTSTMPPDQESWNNLECAYKTKEGNDRRLFEFQDLFMEHRVLKKVDTRLRIRSGGPTSVFLGNNVNEVRFSCIAEDIETKM